jgi:hypothetical protein
VEGALCVAHVRVPENTNLDRLGLTANALSGNALTYNALTNNSLTQNAVIRGTATPGPGGAELVGIELPDGRSYSK